MKQLTFGSLFAGIGGFDLGFERAGMVCKWQVEIDDYATKVLEKHWPNVHRERDIRECGAHNLESVDVICGGFPCVNISKFGDRRGIDDSEDGSGLWREAVRIVRDLRPRMFVVENVAEILVRGRGVCRVFGDLAEIGFDCGWRCLPANLFGAAHRRDRFFAIGISGDAYGGDERAIKEFSDRMPDTSGDCEARWRDYESGMDRSIDGISNRVDRNRGLGNAVVPQVAEWIGRQIVGSVS